jgi:hypothetical protein
MTTLKRQKSDNERIKSALCQTENPTTQVSTAA